MFMLNDAYLLKRPDMSVTAEVSQVSIPARFLFSIRSLMVSSVTRITGWLDLVVTAFSSNDMTKDPFGKKLRLDGHIYAIDTQMGSHLFLVPYPACFNTSNLPMVLLFLRDGKVFPSPKFGKPDDVVMVANAFDPTTGRVLEAEYYIHVDGFPFKAIGYFPASVVLAHVIKEYRTEYRYATFELATARRMCDRTAAPDGEEVLVVSADSVRTLLSVTKGIAGTVSVNWQSGPSSTRKADESLSDIGVRRLSVFECCLERAKFVPANLRQSRISDYEIRIPASAIGPANYSAPPIDYVPRVAYFDIETDYPKNNKLITCLSVCITSRGNPGGHWNVFVVENDETSDNQVGGVWREVVDKLNVTDAGLTVSASEKEMLSAFFAFLQREKVHIVTAYNGWSFDMPVILERCGCTRVVERESEVLSANPSAAVEAFPLSRRRFDRLSFKKKSFYTAGKGHQSLVEFEQGVVGVVYFDALPVCTMSPAKVGNPPNFRLNTLAERAFPNQPHMTKDHLPYARLSEAWRKNRHSRARLLRYVTIDTFVLMKTVEHYDLITQLLKESELLNMDPQKLCSCGEGARAVACLTVIGRQQTPRGTLPMFSSGNASGQVPHMSMLGIPDTVSNRHDIFDEMLRSPLPDGVIGMRNYFYRAPEKTRRTLVLSFAAAGDQERVETEWLSRGFKTYKRRANQDPGWNKIPGGYVREPIEIAAGLTKQVACLDFSSLYPSLMCSFNLCRSTTAPRGYWRAQGVSDKDLFLMPRRHELCRLSLCKNPDGIPVPVPQGEKRWPYGIERTPWDDLDTIQSQLIDSDYRLVCSTPEVLQLEEHVTDDTTASLRTSVRAGDIPDAIKIQLNARKVAKRELASFEKEGNRRMAAVKNAEQNFRKASANSMYGIAAAKTGALSDRYVGEVIPQRGNWAQMRLAELLYTRDWGTHFSIGPERPSHAPCTDAEWMGLCARLSRLLTTKRVRIVYGDTDSIFVHLPFSEEEEPVARLSCCAALYFADVLTRDGFSDYQGAPLPSVKLEAEKLIVNYLSVGQKRYGGILFDCETGEPMRGSFAYDRKPLRVFGDPPNPAADTLVWTAVDGREDAECIVGEPRPGDPACAFYLDTTHSSREDPRVYHPKDIAYACIRHGRFSSLSESPKVEQKGFTKRSFNGNMKELVHLLFYHCVCLSSPPSVLTEAVVSYLAEIAKGAHSPSLFMLNSKISKDPKGGFSEWLKADDAEAKRRRVSVEYERPNAALMAFRREFRARRQETDANDDPETNHEDDGALGEQATRDRHAFFTDRSYDERERREDKKNDYVYPKSFFLDSGGTRSPSLKHEIYEHLKNTVAVLFRAAGVPDLVRDVFYAKQVRVEPNHALYRSVLKHSKNPFTNVPIRWDVALTEGVRRWRATQSAEAVSLIAVDDWLEEARRLFASLNRTSVLQREFEAILPNTIKVLAERERFSCRCVVCGGSGDACCSFDECEKELEAAQRTKASVLATCEACRKATPGAIEEARLVSERELENHGVQPCVIRDVEDLWQAPCSSWSARHKALRIACAVAGCENKECGVMIDRVHAIQRVSQLEAQQARLRNERLAEQ